VLRAGVIALALSGCGKDGSEGDTDGSDDPGSTDAPTATCGDGAVDGDEGCDDGGTAADDGCSASCEVEPSVCSNLPPACAGTPSSDDVTEDCGVFAAADAPSDGADGTRAHPFPSLQRAIDAAHGKRVYACVDGTFEEPLAITRVSEVVGGFDCAGWTWAPDARSQLLGPADQVALRIAASATRVAVSGFVITASSATVDGGSSIAALVDRAAVSLTGVELRAGDGMPGKPGFNWGYAGTDGLDGGAGGEACSAKQVQAEVPPDLTCDDGNRTVGGPGGPGTYVSGGPGGDGAPYIVADGGRGATNNHTNGGCTTGDHGAKGAKGTPGEGANGLGTLDVDGWHGPGGGDRPASAGPARATAAAATAGTRSAPPTSGRRRRAPAGRGGRAPRARVAAATTRPRTARAGCWPRPRRSIRRRSEPGARKTARERRIPRGSEDPPRLLPSCQGDRGGGGTALGSCVGATESGARAEQLAGIRRCARPGGAMPRRHSPRPAVLLLLPVVAAAAGVLAVPSFFQGFETDSAGWFGLGDSDFTRVQSGSASTSYDGSPTAVYADGVDAATGTWYARVVSAVAVPSGGGNGSCTLQQAGGGPALVCYGPYTDWGLGFENEQPFPEGGYTTSVAIYLDTAYASHHPDCGQQGPCVPDTPGVLNPACATDPSGLACEGSRFDWAIGVDTPAGAFLQDYVFNFATGPDPSGSFPGCDEGWIVAANTNSFRSGTNPYAFGFDPKCIATSGWYHFQQVFRDDGTGYLEVLFTVFDAAGSVATCTDEVGATVPCTWTLHPGQLISNVGCPEYGWLANEEINDLPVDDITLIGSCGKTQPTVTTLLSATQGIVGDAVTDAADLSEASDDAGGTVTYTVYTDATCTTPADVGTGAEVGNAGTVDVVDKVVPDSDPVTFGAAGTYYWQAAYSGDAKNKEATSACTSESVEIATQVGRVVPTNTTCSAYVRGAASLDTLTYTSRSGRINSVAPGVYFYYTRVSGDRGDTVSITETHTGTAPSIPILNRQVVLYSSTCTKLTWRSLTVNADGTATGVLPSSGDFIVGVKYDPSSLKGRSIPVPDTTTYAYGTVIDGDPIAADIARIALTPRAKLAAAEVSEPGGCARSRSGDPGADKDVDGGGSSSCAVTPALRLPFGLALLAALARRRRPATR
jgi:cysteine-rich repeat protein